MTVFKRLRSCFFSKIFLILLNSVEKEKVGGSPERGAPRRGWDPAQKFPPNCSPARRRQGWGRAPAPRRPRPPATWGSPSPLPPPLRFPPARGEGALLRRGEAPRGLCARPRRRPRHLFGPARPGRQGPG